MLGELLAHKIFPTEQAGTQTELFAFALVVMFLLVAAYLVGMQVSVARRNAGEPASVPADPASRPYDERIAQVSRHYGLTEREQALLWHLAKGYSSKVIQEKLSISASTVSAHSGSIYRKMGVHSKDEAAAVIRSWDGSGL